MEKRGQATVFVIIGIVILASIFLLFFFRDSLTQTIRQTPTNPQEYLGGQLQDIKNEISRCVTKETNDAVDLLIKNSGNFKLSSGYIQYLNVSYPILCREFNDANNVGCLSKPILISSLQIKLQDYLPEKIESCLNLFSFNSSKITYSQICVMFSV